MFCNDKFYQSLIYVIKVAHVVKCVCELFTKCGGIFREEGEGVYAKCFMKYWGEDVGQVFRDVTYGICGFNKEFVYFLMSRT